MRNSRFWKVLARCFARPTLVVVGAFILASMAMAEMHVLMQAVTEGQTLAEGRVPLPTVIGRVIIGLALMGVAAWVVLRCETSWTKAGRLDWVSYKRNGWTTSRSVVVVLSLLMAWSAMSQVDLLGLTPLELQLSLLIGSGYAMWSAVGFSVLWSLLCSVDTGGNGGGFQGALVPVGPIRPRLRARRELQPA